MDRSDAKRGAGAQSRRVRPRAAGPAVIAVVGLIAATGGCSLGKTEEVGRRCASPRGSATDVAHEPQGRQLADYRDWTTTSGCLVRIDVISETAGPAHCSFERVEIISTGTRIGARFSTSQDTATYIRDPKAVLHDPKISNGFQQLRSLPRGAVDSGLRRGATQLWSRPGDAGAIYLRSRGSVERWPRGRFLCL